MKQLTSFLFLLLLLMSCAGKSNSDSPVRSTAQKGIESMLAELSKYEDSLKKSTKDLTQLNQNTAIQYAEQCLRIKNAFPKSKEAPKMMNKAHIILSSVGLYQRSVVIADSLILMYPMYEKRSMVLESLASTYDIFIVPRRKELVEKYYKMLLQENWKMQEDQKQLIEKRLQYIDLPFEEYIQKVNQK